MGCHIVVRLRLITLSTLYTSIACSVAFLLVSVEVVEEQVVVFNFVVKMVHYLLLFVNLDSETTSIIEDVILVLLKVVDFATQTSTTC